MDGTSRPFALFGPQARTSRVEWDDNDMLVFFGMIEGERKAVFVSLDGRNLKLEGPLLCAEIEIM